MAHRMPTGEIMGPVKAQAIIDHRKANGPFKSVDQLKDVKGIGDATFDKIKADVSVSGTTTPAAKAPAATPAPPAAPMKAEAQKTPAAAPAAPAMTAKEKTAADAKTAKEDKAAEAKKADATKK